MNHVIAFCSPNGATRQVAEVIKTRLRALGDAAVLVDLAHTDPEQAMASAMRGPERPRCLWVGSPVYADHMVPPVEKFLKNLPAQDGLGAVPFVTWGGVNSGVALHDMGTLLREKGMILLGAAKVLAVHSVMWRSEQPVGAGHPDPNDDAQVQALVDAIHATLSSQTLRPLPLAALAYQPPEIRDAAAKKSIAAAKTHFPALSVTLEQCNQCGLCAEVCQAQAIALDPYPRFGEDCFLCLKCVRECPQDAIPMDLSAAEERIRTLAAKIGETPPTCIFVQGN